MPKLLLIASLLMGLILSSPNVVARELQAKYQPVNDYVQNNKKIINLAAGTAVAVIKGNEVVYEGYFGYSDIATKKPVDENTLFYIASMTKAFYSLLILMEEQQGKIETSQTLARLFPDLQFDPVLKSDKVTVQDLLIHTSGIDNWPLVQATAYTGLHNKKLIDEIIQNSYANERAPLGTFGYSNVGYNILSHWMDNTYAQNWQSLLQSQIFTPLEMQHTSARMSDITKKNWNLARGYSVKSPNPTSPIYLTKNDATMHAAGGMVSTARDLARFLTMHIHQGKLDSKQIIPESVIKKSQRSEINFVEHGRPRKYGWGWYVRELFSHKLLEHRGGYPGAHTYMSFMPEKQLGLVVLSAQDKWGGDLAYALEDIAYAISLGKDNDEISKLFSNNESRARKNASKFYKQKSVAISKNAKQLSLEYIGVYKHPTLGDIKVSQVDANFYLSWGNLSSPLLISEQSNQLQVEFYPNELHPISFKKSMDGKKYIEFRSNRFSNSG